MVTTNLINIRCIYFYFKLGQYRQDKLETDYKANKELNIEVIVSLITSNTSTGIQLILVPAFNEPMSASL